jgi:hypothetical protein
MDTEEMLSRYLEEDLDQDERVAVEALLKEQPEIRAELEGLRQTLSLMQRLPPLEAPPDFVQQVKRKVRRQKRIRIDQQPQFRTPYEILGIILVILMLVLYLLIQQHDTPPPKPPTSKPAQHKAHTPKPAQHKAHTSKPAQHKTK